MFENLNAKIWNAGGKSRVWLSIFFLFLALFLFVWFYLFHNLPSIDSLSQKLNQTSIRITDRNGQLLYDVLPEGGGRHIVLSFGNIPQCMKDASIAVEDANFYRHPGVDAIGVIRALWINIKSGETVAGGSTITQQVARTLLFSNSERMERTLRRKLRESILAWQLTRKYSKDEILALYLNQSYYGGMAYGVEAASQTYFGKSASDLLLPECALLAGLTQRPGVYNPYTNPDLAIERQHIVLGLMEKHGYITGQERLGAENTPLSFNPTPYPIEAPHFVWMVKDQLDALYVSGKLDPSQSLMVRTTLDLNMQHLAEETVKRHIARLKMNEGAISHNVNNAAVVVLDPSIGDILALVGSADYFDADIRGALNMAISPRQTGSAFKPLIYASALDPQQAQPWTAATSILDVKTTFIINDASSYQPINYDGREHGYVSVREALASSLNIPAVKTLQKVTVKNVIDFARRLGITSLDDPNQYDLSLALGGGEVSLLELTSAFGTLANQGAYTGYTSILDIRDADGTSVYQPEKTTPIQIIDPRVAWLISDILSDDHARLTGFGLNSTLQLDRPAAVKTGTTTNFHDNWTIGYTPDLVLGVWVGNSTHEAIWNVTGLTGAAPIWHDTIRGILEGRPEKSFVRPDGLKQVQVCDLSGLLPTDLCSHTKLEWFIDGTQPTQPDSLYKQIWIDRVRGALANDQTPVNRRQSVVVLDVPPEVQTWAHEHGYSLLSDYSSSDSNFESELRLISPAPNTTYRISPNLDLAAQQLVVEAVSGQGFSSITLWVDGEALASFSAPPYQAWWKLSEGTHRFWAEGANTSGNLVKTNEVIVTVLK